MKSQMKRLWCAELAWTQTAALAAAVIIYNIMRRAWSFQKNCRATLIQMAHLKRISASFFVIDHSSQPSDQSKLWLLFVFGYCYMHKIESVSCSDAQKILSGISKILWVCLFLNASMGFWYNRSAAFSKGCDGWWMLKKGSSQMLKLTGFSQENMLKNHFPSV